MGQPLATHKKKIPAWSGIFQKRRTPLSLIHDVQHVLKHVYAPRGFFLVKRVEHFIDFFGAWVAVFGNNAVNRLKFDFFQWHDFLFLMKLFRQKGFGLIIAGCPATLFFSAQNEQCNHEYTAHNDSAVNNHRGKAR